MFRDPYSERQSVYRFFSANRLFIAAAVILAGIAAVELALIFRSPARETALPTADGEAITAIAAEQPLSDGQNEAEREIAALPGDPDGDWRLVLVNESHPLPEDYAISLVRIRSNTQIDERIRDPLNRMLETAGTEGLIIVVASAYRSIERQWELFDNKVARLIAQGINETDAQSEAAKEVAWPGSSEHHLGLAVDLVAYHNQRLDDTQDATEENKWLREHCHEFGFILRYPPDKSEITGVIYEPWHFRYVGPEAAEVIMARGLCLEEYLDSLAPLG